MLRKPLKGISPLRIHFSYCWKLFDTLIVLNLIDKDGDPARTPFAYHRRNLWLHFYYTNTSTKCAKRILIQFDRADTLIWRYQPFKNNIACFSSIESSTSFTSKVSTLTVNAEGIANRKLSHDSTCTCCRYAQGKKKSTDFVLISPSTLPLTNCWFRFSKGLWDLYTIYHDNDISYRAIAKHKEGGLEYLP